MQVWWRFKVSKNFRDRIKCFKKTLTLNNIKDTVGTQGLHTVSMNVLVMKHLYLWRWQVKDIKSTQQIRSHCYSWVPSVQWCKVHIWRHIHMTVKRLLPTISSLPWLAVELSKCEGKQWHPVVNVCTYSSGLFPLRFSGHPTLEPRHFIDEKVVNEYHPDYMFLECIKFINEVGKQNSKHIKSQSSPFLLPFLFFICFLFCSNTLDFTHSHLY